VDAARLEVDELELGRASVRSNRPGGARSSSSASRSPIVEFRLLPRKNADQRMSAPLIIRPGEAAHINSLYIGVENNRLAAPRIHCASWSRGRLRASTIAMINASVWHCGIHFSAGALTSRWACSSSGRPHSGCWAWA
jgi:hypothetical protein